MPTKIRLQRRGKKARPFYHIVIADGRAPRDGKFIEKIGTYNPITNPADIQLNFDRALYWLQTGAQPTNTVRNLLSYKGVIYKNHLLTGVKKGALTEEQAEAKFQAWLSEKEAKIENKKKDAELSLKDTRKKALEAEKLVKENRAKEIIAKHAAAVEKEVEAVKEEVKEEEEQKAEEGKTEEQKTEEKKEEAKEEVKAEEPKEEEPKKEEAKEEVKAEEPKEEEPKEEAKEEVKAEEPKEEEPKEEAKEEVKAEEEQKTEEKEEEDKEEKEKK